MSAHKLYAPKGVGRFTFVVACDLWVKTSADIRNVSDARALKTFPGIVAFQVKLQTLHAKSCSNGQYMIVLCAIGLRCSR